MRKNKLSISEAAQALGVSASQVHNMIVRGDLVADRDPSAKGSAPVWRIASASVKRAKPFGTRQRPTAKQLEALRPKREAELARRAQAVSDAKKVTKKATKKTAKKAA